MILEIGLLFSYQGTCYFVNQNKFKKIQDGLEKLTKEMTNYNSYDKYRLTTKGFIFSKKNKFYIIELENFIPFVVNDCKLARSFHSKVYDKIYGYGLFIETSIKYFVPMTDIDDLFDYTEKFNNNNNVKDLDHLFEEDGEFFCIKYEKQHLLKPHNVLALNLLD